MRLGTAIERLFDNYVYASDKEWINDKVAWALYQTWKVADIRKADTPQTDRQRLEGKRWTDALTTEEKKCMLDALDFTDTPQTESTGSPIGDYRDGVGAWAPMPLGDPGSISDGTLLTALETWLNRNPDKQIKVDKRITRHGPVFTASIELVPRAIQKEE